MSSLVIAYDHVHGALIDIGSSLYPPQETDELHSQVKTLQDHILEIRSDVELLSIKRHQFSELMDLRSRRMRRKKTRQKYRISSRVLDQTQQSPTLTRYDDALKRRDFELVCWMIDSNEVPVDQAIGVGDTALMLAAAENNITAIQLLITRGANINAANKKGRTALMRAACQSISVEAVELLLLHAPNIMLLDSGGKTALDWARLTNNHQAVALLEQELQILIDTERKGITTHQNLVEKDQKIKLNESLWLELAVVIDHYDASEIRRIVSSSPVSLTQYQCIGELAGNFYINRETSIGWTALSKASSFGDISTMNILLDCGADPHYETRLKHTAMTWASYCGHDQACYVLLQSGVDIEASTSEGKTALIHASTGGKAAVVKGILQKYHALCLSGTINTDYVDPVRPEWHIRFMSLLDTRDMCNKKAIDYAEERGHHETVMILNDAYKRAAVNEKHIAAVRDATQIVQCEYKCGYSAPQDLITHHEDHECPERLAYCHDCEAQIMAKLLETHMANECPKRQCRCKNLQFGCMQILPFDDMIHHEEQHCKKREVACRLCGHSMRWDEREIHEVELCGERVTSCNLCNISMKAKALRQHIRNECRCRTVTCTLHGGCGISMKLEDEEYHNANLCENRPMPCRWEKYGCTREIGPISTRAAHETTACQYHPISCPNNCGESGLVQQYLDFHLTNLCLRTVVPCPLDCGQTLERRFIAGHSHFEWGDCKKRLCRCKLDYQGKKLRIFPPLGDTMGPPFSAAADEDHEISTYGLEQRLCLLREARHQQAETMKESTSRSYIIRQLDAEISRLSNRFTSLCRKIEEEKQLATVISFRQSDGMHLLDFGSTREWHRLDHMRFEECESMVWTCGYVTAEDRTEHEATKCSFRLVMCQLGCGHKMEYRQMAIHMEKRCNMRDSECRIGCGKIMKLNELLHHEDTECQNRETTCTHCHIKMKAYAMDDHLRSECRRVPRACRLGCGNKISSDMIADHEINECDKRNVACPKCGQTVWSRELESHLEFDCKLRVMGPCQFECGTILLVAEVEQHVNNECSKRTVQCTQCSADVIYDALNEHKKLICPHRFLRCTRGCGAFLKDSEREEHEENECQQRLTRCSNGCGVEIFLLNREEHEQRHCLRRIIQCPNRCHDIVRSHQLEDHLVVCERRIIPCGSGGKHCARPIRAWIHGNLFCGEGDLDACKSHSENALTWAVRMGDLRLTGAILDKVSSGNMALESTSGHCVLTLACANGDIEMVKLLLKYGANVCQETSRGRTPLAEACRSRSEGLVNLLLSHRAQLSYKNRFGVSPLRIAEEYMDSDFFEYLKDTQALSDMQNELFRAISRGDYAILSKIVSGGDNIYRPNHLKLLENEVEDLQTELQTLQNDLQEHVSIMNESIALREKKQALVVQLVDSIEHTKGKLTHLKLRRETLTSERCVAETNIVDAVSDLTAREITKVLNEENPDQATRVVLKAVCLLNGVFPKSKPISSSDQDYTDKDWWKASQALMMDRGFLKRLKEYRQANISTAVLSKVKRECTRDTMLNSIAEDVESGEKEVEQKSASTLTNALGVWVKGVETEERWKREEKLLESEENTVSAELEKIQVDLQTAIVNMKTATRSLPARQKEVSDIKAKERLLLGELELRKRKVQVCKILQLRAASGHTALSFAASYGDEGVVGRLLSYGANLGYSDEERKIAATVIQFVVRHFLWKCNRQPWNIGLADEYRTREISYIFALRPQLHKLVYYRITYRVPLHEAAFNGHAAVMKLLIEHGSVPWRKTYVLPMPMIPGAVKNPSVPNPALNSWTLCYLKQPLAISETLELGRTQRECSAFRIPGGWDIEKTLFSDAEASLQWILHGVSRSMKASRDEVFRRKKLLKMTQEHDIICQRIEKAISTADFAAVNGLLNEGAYADFELKNGLTVLMFACTKEYYVVNDDGDTVLAVKYLLDREKSRPMPDFESTTEKTALICAVHYDSLKCARVLLDKKANINFATKKSGLTALMAAAKGRKSKAVSFLLRNGAASSLKDSRGWSAFSYARANKDDEILGILAKFEAGNFGFIASTIGQAEEKYSCRHGCGFFAAVKTTVIENLETVAIQNSLHTHETQECPKRVVVCPNDCDIENIWAEDLSHHLEYRCPNRPTQCTSSNCPEKIPHRLLEEHILSQCNYRKVYCQYDCGESMIAQKVKAHEANQCRLRPIECPVGCGEMTRQIDLSSHIKCECSVRKVRCRAGCGAQVPFFDRAQHEQNSCPLRRVPCKWGCDNDPVAHLKTAHENEHCSLRVVVCPQEGCSDHFQSKNQEDHLKNNCVTRLVPCRLGCSLKIKFISIKEHEENECAKRKLPCGKCQHEIAVSDAASHEKNNCIYRMINCAWCGRTICFDNKETHRKFECPRRLVDCRFGCLSRGLHADEIYEHESFKCRLRLVDCPWGCGKAMVAKAVGSHEDRCSMRFVKCELGCGIEIRVKDKALHEKEACPHRNS